MYLLLDVLTGNFTLQVLQVLFLLRFIVIESSFQPFCLPLFISFRVQLDSLAPRVGSAMLEYIYGIFKRLGEDVSLGWFQAEFPKRLWILR